METDLPKILAGWLEDWFRVNPVVTLAVWQMLMVIGGLGYTQSFVRSAAGRAWGVFRAKPSDALSAFLTALASEETRYEDKVIVSKEGGQERRTTHRLLVAPKVIVTYEGDALGNVRCIEVPGARPLLDVLTEREQGLAKAAAMRRKAEVIERDRLRDAAHATFCMAQAGGGSIDSKTSPTIKAVA